MMMMEREGGVKGRTCVCNTFFFRRGFSQGDLANVMCMFFAFSDFFVQKYSKVACECVRLRASGKRRRCTHHSKPMLTPSRTSGNEARRISVPFALVCAVAAPPHRRRDWWCYDSGARCVCCGDIEGA